MTTPALPFLSIRRWGPHYHGLVEEGEITLPDNSTVTYPQPHNGDCWVVNFSSNTPAVVKDIDGAKQLLNYGFITGFRQVVGETFGDSGSFLHRDEGGRVWHVNVTRDSSSGDDVILKIDYERFGYFKIDAPSNTTKTIYKTIATGLTHTTGGIDILLGDISHTGNKIALFARREHHLMCFELTLSGEIDPVTLNGLSVSSSVFVAQSEYITWYYEEDNSTTTLRAPDIAGTTVTASGVDLDCPTSFGETAGPSSASATIAESTSIVDNYDDELVMTKVEAVMYNNNGVLQKIKKRLTATRYHQYSNHASHNVTVSLSSTVSGWSAGNTGFSGPCVGQPYSWTSVSPVSIDVKTITWGSESTWDYRFKIEMLIDDLSVFDVTCSEAGNNISTSTLDVSIPIVFPQYIPSIHNQNLTSDSTGSTTKVGLHDTIDPLKRDPLVFIENAFTEYAAYLANGSQPTGDEDDITYNSTTGNRIKLYKFSFKLAGLKYGVNLQGTSEFNSALPDVLWYDCITPEGGDGVEIYGARENVYGTYNPVTEEIIRNKPHKVCFV